MAKTVEINNIIYYTYADLTDASTYNNAIVGSTWATKTATQQSQYLVMATRKIDSYNYAGQKIDPNQPLKFPRIMTSGKTSDDDVLTQLCCQVATYYCDNGSSGGDSGDFMSNVENYQIGDLHVKFKKDATLDLTGLDDLIEQALKDWLTNQGMEIWL
jgi:hypothetical protein